MKARKLKDPYPRYRARIAGNRLHGGGEYWWVNNGVQGTKFIAPPLVTTTTETMSDTVTPGYQQLVAKGAIINTPYSRMKSVITGGNGGNISVKWQNGGTTAVLNCTGYAFRDAVGNYSWAARPSGYDYSTYRNLISYAQTKALSGVESATMQSMVTMGEFRETARMLVSPLRGLTKWLERAKRDYERDLQRFGRKAMEAQARIRNKRLLAQIIRERAAERGKRRKRSMMDRIAGFGSQAADAVLGYNLGWKPFLSDIDKILHKIPSLENEERRSSRSTRSSVDKYSNTYEKSTAYGVNVGRLETEIEVLVRCSVLWRDKFEVSEHFGLRLDDVPESIYELIPLSFLVDYVVNVGDYLGALRAKAYADIVAYSTVIHVKAKEQRTWDSVKSIIAHPGVGNVVGAVESRDPGSPEVLHFEVSERSVDSFGPSMAYGRPGGERPPAQAQNVAALLTNQLLKLR